LKTTKQGRESRGDRDRGHNSPAAAPIPQHYHLKLTSKHAPGAAKEHMISHLQPMLRM